MRREPEEEMIPRQTMKTLVFCYADSFMKPILLSHYKLHSRCVVFFTPESFFAICQSLTDEKKVSKYTTHPSSTTHSSSHHTPIFTPHTLLHTTHPSSHHTLSRPHITHPSSHHSTHSSSNQSSSQHTSTYSPLQNKPSFTQQTLLHTAPPVTQQTLLHTTQPPSHATPSFTQHTLLHTTHPPSHYTPSFTLHTFFTPLTLLHTTHLPLHHVPSATFPLCIKAKS